MLTATKQSPAKSASTQKKVLPSVSSADTIAERHRLKPAGMTASIIPAIPHGATKTDTSGLSAELTMSSNPPATVSDRLKSSLSSWSFLMCSNAP